VSNVLSNAVEAAGLILADPRLPKKSFVIRLAG
jgi:hypothetical protein